MHLTGNGHGLSHGVQSEPVHKAPVGDFVGVAVSHTVEVALIVASQGVGGDADFAHSLHGTQELVHGHQLVIGHTIQDPRFRIVGHIREDDTQIGHISGLRGIFFIQDIQVAFGSGSKDHAVHICCSQEGLLASGQSLSSCQIIVSAKADPGVGGRIKRNHVRSRQRLADLDVHLVGDHIHGVVRNLQQELLAVHTLQIQDEAAGLARLCIGSGPLIGQRHGAACVIQDRSRQVPVIAGSHRHGIASEAEGNILQDRSRVIDDCRHLQGGAFAQGIPIHSAVLLHIQLRSQGQGQLNGIPFLQTGRRPVQIQVVAGLLPGGCPAVVIRSAHSAGLGRGQNLARFNVGYGKTRGAGISNRREGPLAKLVAPLAVDSVPLRHILLVGN